MAVHQLKTLVDPMVFTIENFEPLDVPFGGELLVPITASHTSEGCTKLKLPEKHTTDITASRISPFNS